MWQLVADWWSKKVKITRYFKTRGYDILHQCQNQRNGIKKYLALLSSLHEYNKLLVITKNKIFHWLLEIVMFNNGAASNENSFNPAISVSKAFWYKLFNYFVNYGSQMCFLVKL